MPRWKQNVERRGVSFYVRWGLCRRRLLSMRRVAWKGGLQPFDLPQVSNITMEELGSNLPSVLDLSHQISSNHVFNCRHLLWGNPGINLQPLVWSSPVAALNKGMMAWHTMGWLWCCDDGFWWYSLYGLVWSEQESVFRHLRIWESELTFLFLHSTIFYLYKALRAERCF